MKDKNEPLKKNMSDAALQRSDREAKKKDDTDSRLSLDALRLDALYSVSRAITTLMPLGELWEHLYEEIVEVIPGDAFSVTTYDEKTDMAHSLFSVDTVDGEIIREYETESYQIAGRFSEKIVRTGKGQMILRHKGEETEAEKLRPFGHTGQLSRSLLFAPMKSGDKVLGIVTVQSYSPDAYEEADLALLEAIAASGALALENARLYTALSEQNRELARAHDRLHEAHEHQREELERMRRALDEMRWALPAPAGWEIARYQRTAEEVGGDYSHFFEDQQAGTVSFVIADASGHGPSAAVFTAMTHIEAVSALRRGLSPAAALAEINLRLTQALPLSGFVTMVCGLLDCKTGELEYAGGGHPPAILWHHKERKAELWTVKQGPALGLYEQAEFPATRRQMQPGDKLLFYTDGLTETCSPSLEELGEDRMVQVMASSGEEHPESILRVIDDMANSWRHGDVPDDDCLMVILSRQNGRVG